MAIFHFDTGIVQRSQGESSVQKATYFSGESLRDERTGETHYPEDKERVVYTEIIVPEYAPDWARSRSELWNGTENREPRKASQVARWFEGALARELSLDQWIEIGGGWIREWITPLGLVADFAIHRDPESKNAHLHILCTERPFAMDGWATRKLRQWKDRRANLREWRRSWAEHTNAALEKAGFDVRVDHRSHEERGLLDEPTIKEGAGARARHNKGLQSDRVQANEQIKFYNQIRRDLAKSVKSELEREMLNGMQRPIDAAYSLRLPKRGSKDVRPIRRTASPNDLCRLSESGVVDRKSHPNGILPALSPHNARPRRGEEDSVRRTGEGAGAGSPLTRLAASLEAVGPEAGGNDKQALLDQLKSLSHGPRKAATENFEQLQWLQDQKVKGRD